jgi:hypothetical protein
VHRPTLSTILAAARGRFIGRNYASPRGQPVQRQALPGSVQTVASACCQRGPRVAAAAAERALLAGRCAAVVRERDPAAGMDAGKWIALAALGSALLAPASAAAALERPRPSDVPGAETTLAPNGFQVYNDYASPERTYSSRRAVVHFVVLGIDAPPLNDDDADGVPDYVERVGEAADRALAYYERRGFRRVLPDEGGPDTRPDVYVTRFAPGTLGVAFPRAAAEGGAFAVVSNNLDPSAGRSFASVFATVAHELFHLVQFSYLGRGSEPAIPAWILEGTASALETRVNPELDDLVSTIQLRRWFSATGRSMTTQAYGAQLLWRWLDRQHPTLLPVLLRRLAALPEGDGERSVATTFTRVAGGRFTDAFHRFAVSVAAEHADDIVPVLAPRRAVLAPLSVTYVRVALPRAGRSRLTVTFPRGRSGAAATLVYRIANDVAGEPARFRRIAPRAGRGGDTLVFGLSAGPRTSATLVLSNGDGEAVPYAVSAR